MQLYSICLYFLSVILLSAPFSNTLSPCSSLNVRDQRKYTIITTGKIHYDEKTKDHEMNGSKHYPNLIFS